MQNEVELKIMLLPENIPLVIDFLSKQQMIEQGTLQLGNTYYDSKECYFAKHKMGLRVRTQNHQHEMTLKMKGDIVGGLHIRPEYNLDLPNNKPDFKRLVSHYNLQFEGSSILDAELFPTFSTDFERDYWLIKFQQSEIEIALDRGLIKNPYGEEAICEIEFELKQGNLSDIFDFLSQMPKEDGMWLSSLSKAQRGYLVGNREKIAKEIEKLTACNFSSFNKEIERYQFEQQLADFIRLSSDQKLTQLYEKCTGKTLEKRENLLSKAYLSENIQKMETFYIL